MNVNLTEDDIRRFSDAVRDAVSPATLGTGLYFEVMRAPEAEERHTDNLIVGVFPLTPDEQFARTREEQTRTPITLRAPGWDAPIPMLPYVLQVPYEHVAIVADVLMALAPMFGPAGIFVVGEEYSRHITAEENA